MTNITDLIALVGPQVGIFLGGSTEWKLANMRLWGEFCAARDIHYHVARVNSAKRLFMAIGAGAHSVDGSSASRYAVTIAALASASRQGDLYAPHKLHESDTASDRPSPQRPENG